MEKFQKYCLSVLLVIICNNISAHVHNGTIESDDCKRLREVYSKFLGTQDYDQVFEFLAKKKTSEYCTLNQKQKVFDAIGETIVPNHHHNFYNDYLGLNYSQRNKHNKNLENFERQNKEYNFVENIYFTSKVSKVRNKDYLDLIS
ncbi:hypothetical protein [Chryseobacterium sp. ERMR1:04]|uniref:hypothetical protein n=1 Tax=Chryseobacterium sp. ERMR1:04 TaxID=1705393 RepID=UPI0006C84BBD|nr:hypothetical protein [Chryseobacterium sp. ERMR1:04]KPH11961.1 hypothetical protein AMQ68_21715 [Chryseobacterium sp. ERMR1:04]